MVPDQTASPAPPEIAVIIATYKRPHLIERALDSVAAQTLRPAEIIVVDDCSGDHTGEVVRAWSMARAVPVHFIAMAENSGVGAARNRALEQARSEYAAFLDSDDEYLPDALERLSTPLLDRPEAVVSFADASVIHADGRPSFLLMSRALSAEKDCVPVEGTGGKLLRLADPKSTLLLTSMIPTCSAVFRLEAARNVGFMPEDRFGEDWLFWLRMTDQGSFLCRFTTVAQVHRQEDNLTGSTHSTTSSRMVLRAFFGLLQGQSGVTLDDVTVGRLKRAIAAEVRNWRYQHSRLGLRAYLQALDSEEGRMTGGRLRHLLADPKSVLRAFASVG